MGARRPSTAGVALGLAVVAASLGFALPGCASLATRVPLVTPAMTATAVARGQDPAALERGREIYVGRCTRCHGPVAVASREARQWDVILPRMAAETRLDLSETADLAAYVEAAGAADGR